MEPGDREKIGMMAVLTMFIGFCCFIAGLAEISSTLAYLVAGTILWFLGWRALDSLNE